jgi:predicted membrane protein
MAKFKVYDIRPPQRRAIKQIPKVSASKQTSYFMKITALFIIFAALFLIITQFLYAKRATIEIWPSTRKISFQAFLTGSQEAKEVDFLNQTIPIVSLEKELTLAKKFPASRIEVKEKARGIIRVYNKYHLPVTLVAKTRFQSSTEPPRVFLATKKFTIPANGYIDIEVVAAEPGEEYNIEPCAFSVPGLRKFSPPQLYYSVYGKSFSRMEGGKIGEVSKITSEDLERAKEEILAEAEKKALQSLQEMAGSEYKILEKTLKTEILETGAVDTKVGQLKDDFLYQIRIKAQVLAIKLSHLYKFINQYLKSKIPLDQEIHRESIQIKNLIGNVDIEGTITVDVEFEAEVYPKIDIVSIKEVAKAQRISNIKKYIAEIYPEISREPKIRLSPFFCKKAPKRPENIKIILKFE